MRIARFVSRLAALFLVTSHAAVWADNLGTLTYHGQTVQLNYAYAFTQPDKPDGGQQTIILALADKPFDSTKLDASAVRESELNRQLSAPDTNMIELTIAPDSEQSIIHWQAAGKRGGTMLSAYAFDMPQRDAQHIAGTLKSTRAADGGKAFPDNPRLDLRFSVVLAAAPQLSAPLPADGGEPGHAYLVYDAALWKSDLAALSAADKDIDKWIQQRRGDKNFERSFALLRDIQALRAPKIVSAFQQDDKATLAVRGEDTGGVMCEGTVVMHRVDGRWGVELIKVHHGQ